MGYISDTARNRTHNLFRPKRESIPLGHSECLCGFIIPGALYQVVYYITLHYTYKSLQFKQPSSILDLLKIQPTHFTRSSAVATIQRPSNPSQLKITDRSFYHQAPALWNALYLTICVHFLQHHLRTQTNNSLLSLSSSQFHKQLKTYLFLQFYPP